MIVTCICCFSWSTFWTALTAVGTIAMAVATFCSLRQNDKLLVENKKQLEEMKRQWNEENKPKLEIKLVNSPNVFELDSTSIQIYNYGKSLADNIKIIFDKSFIDSVPVESLRKHIDDLQVKTYSVLPGNTIIIPFCNFSDNINNPGYMLYGQEISLDEKYSLVDFLKKTFRLTVACNKLNQGLEETTLSYNDISQRNTSIQDELSYIQLQIGLLRTNLNSKKDNE